MGTFPLLLNWSGAPGILSEYCNDRARQGFYGLGKFGRCKNSAYVELLSQLARDDGIPASNFCQISFFFLIITRLQKARCADTSME